MIDLNLSWEDYQKLQRMNVSTLVHGKKSMLALKQAIQRGFTEPTDAMRLGSGIHCLLLEPEEFQSRFVVLPEFHLSPENVTAKGDKTESKSTKFYKEAVKQFAAENAGKSFLSAGAYKSALCAIESLRSKPYAMRLVEACGSNVELSVIGEIEGVAFKGRIDALSAKCLVDLKTTASVEPVSFGRQFANLSYDIKLACYRELVRQHSTSRQVVVIAQEVSGAFDTVVFDVPEIVIDNGFAKAQRILADYKQCLETGVWPGVDRGQDTVPLIVPQWAMEDAGEELLDWSTGETDDVEVAF